VGICTTTVLEMTLKGVKESKSMTFMVLMLMGTTRIYSAKMIISTPNSHLSLGSRPRQ
jgi:hypothetical protein